jgi:hypothetical protein
MKANYVRPLVQTLSTRQILECLGPAQGLASGSHECP